MSHLTAPADVVEVLGGYRRLSDALGLRSPGTVYNWVERKRLPARYYLAMTSGLANRGHTAPPSLWGMWEGEL